MSVRGFDSGTVIVAAVIGNASSRLLLGRFSVTAANELALGSSALLEGLTYTHPDGRRLTERMFQGVETLHYDDATSVLSLAVITLGGNCLVADATLPPIASESWPADVAPRIADVSATLIASEASAIQGISAGTTQYLFVRTTPGRDLGSAVNVGSTDQQNAAVRTYVSRAGGSWGQLHAEGCSVALNFGVGADDLGDLYLSDLKLDVGNGNTSTHELRIHKLTASSQSPAWLQWQTEPEWRDRSDPGFAPVVFARSGGGVHVGFRDATGAVRWAASRQP